MILSIIVAYAVACGGKYVIGKDNAIPWHDPQDLARFRENTMGHAIVMGRKTFESIGRPLKGRLNIILTRQKNYEVPGAHVFGDLDEALQFAASEHSEVFIIGGQELYEQTLNRADRLYITYIREKNIEGDTFFPFWDRRDYRVIQKEGEDKTKPEFEVLQRVLNSEPNSDSSTGPTNPETMAYPFCGGI